MASLRKYPKLPAPPKKAWITADRTLLAGVFALMGFGAMQTSAITIASNDQSAAPIMTAARPNADYTPVGSIDGAKSGAVNKTLQAPFGLRSQK